jgi:hypothetical protein
MHHIYGKTDYGKLGSSVIFLGRYCTILETSLGAVSISVQESRAYVRHFYGLA